MLSPDMLLEPLEVEFIFAINTLDFTIRAFVFMVPRLGDQELFATKIGTFNMELANKSFCKCIGDDVGYLTLAVWTARIFFRSKLCLVAFLADDLAASVA